MVRDLKPKDRRSMLSSIKHILIPTDFSVSAKKASFYAGAIAEKYNAKITLLNVIEPPFNFPANIEGVIDYLKENAEQHLDKMEKSIYEKYPEKKFNVRKQIRIGKPVSQILEAIGDSKIDLVVMGSVTGSNKREILFGSVSGKIMMNSLKPVLLIPEKTGDQNFKNVLFTTNFRPGDYTNLKDLAGFADRFGSNIHLLHVAKEKDLETEIKFRGIKDLITEKNFMSKIKFSLVINPDTIYAVSKYADSKSIHIIVMNRYKKSVLDSLINEDHTMKMRIYSTSPILVMPGE